jgi:CheY-like chemotaxis protein/HPt (histidine-containing phosphotransfer) domain-containing protein
MKASVSSVSATPDVPALLDDDVLAKLYEDFASTDDLPDLAELIRRFLERGDGHVSDLAAAVDGGDPEEIRQAAHRIKGSTRTLGAELCGAVAERIEMAAAASDVAEARRRLPELEIVFSLSRAALTDVVDAIDGGGTVEPHGGAGGVGLRVLLVDDEPISLAVTRAAVERLGHDCTVVTDGQAALEAYRSARPAIVITDFHMPRMGGLELAAAIRATGDRSTYIAVVSATAGRADAEIGDTVDAALSKPVREDELRAVLGLAAHRAA